MYSWKIFRRNLVGGIIPSNVIVSYAYIDTYKIYKLNNSIRNFNPDINRYISNDMIPFCHKFIDNSYDLIWNSSTRLIQGSNNKWHCCLINETTISDKFIYITQTTSKWHKYNQCSTLFTNSNTLRYSTTVQYENLSSIKVKDFTYLRSDTINWSKYGQDEIELISGCFYGNLFTNISNGSLKIHENSKDSIKYPMFFKNTYY